MCWGIHNDFWGGSKHKIPRRKITKNNTHPQNKQQSAEWFSTVHQAPYREFFFRPVPRDRRNNRPRSFASPAPTLCSQSPPGESGCGNAQESHPLKHPARIWNRWCFLFLWGYRICDSSLEGSVLKEDIFQKKNKKIWENNQKNWGWLLVVWKQQLYFMGNLPITYTYIHYNESNSFQTESSKKKCYPLWCLIVLTRDVFRCETTALIAHPSNL